MLNYLTFTNSSSRTCYAILKLINAKRTNIADMQMHFLHNIEFCITKCVAFFDVYLI